MENSTNTNTATIPPYLIGKGLPISLNLFGTLYFLFSFIGGIILWSQSKEEVWVSGSLYISGHYETVINYVARSIGVAGVFSSIVVLLICTGIARAINQNIYIIETNAKIFKPAPKRPEKLDKCEICGKDTLMNYGEKTGMVCKECSGKEQSIKENNQ